jgi:DNA-binding PadR family transcriptional regulator
MAARIEQVSGGRMQLNMGTLYPGLMRLEQRGFVRGTWGVTESNRKARFYALTPAGKRQLAAEKREWNRMVTTNRRFSTSRADVRCYPRGGCADSGQRSTRRLKTPRWRKSCACPST